MLYKSYSLSVRFRSITTDRPSSTIGEDTAPTAAETVGEPSLPDDEEPDPTFDRSAIALAPYTDDIDF